MVIYNSTQIPTHEESSKESSHYDYIDSLRAFAILLVIMVHSSQRFGITCIGKLDGALGCGMYGVQMFFIASAFTLFLSYKNRQAIEKHYMLNFFIRRFFRIAPLYYIGIIYYYFQNCRGSVSVGEFAANVCFVNDVHPLWMNHLVPGGWSIAVEMTFYLLVPLLFCKIKNIGQAVRAFLLAIVCNALLRFLMLLIPICIEPHWIWTEFLYYWLPNQLPVFLMGVIMYFIVVEKNSLKDVPSLYWLLIAAVLLVNKMFDLRLLIFSNHWFALIFLLFGIALSKKQFVIFVNPITKYIGKVSFSMYLVHFAVMYWLERFGCMPHLNIHPALNYALWYVMVVIITVAISTITYNVIEQPFQNLGKILIKKRENRHVGNTQSI